MLFSADAAITGSYDYSEVTKSILISIGASYAALDLAGRVASSSGRARTAWLLGGAIAMGIGVWAMHFKALLAFHLPVPVEYYWPSVLASLLLAILASAVALYVASRQKMGPVEAIAGSVIVGGGVAGMYYVGIAAMRLPANIRFSPLLAAVSVLLGILFSLLALLMAFDLREETRWGARRRLGSATVMGVAVCSMQYTGMAALKFTPGLPPNLSRAVSISPLFNDGVAIVTLIVLVAASVTSSVDRRAEAQVQRLNQDLERRVAQRTSQLEAVNQSLRNEIVERERTEEALQKAQDDLARVTHVVAMGELATTIAHEINQPLAAIVTNANFGLHELAVEGQKFQKLREAIVEIANEGAWASAVISRIRALLQKGAPQRVELDINHVIEEVTILLRARLTRNRVSLRIDLGADLPRLIGDRVQLQQVLINLVMNGIDAMVTVTDRPRELLIMSARHTHGVLVQVQDSGAGFDPEQADRIFEPFFTTKREGVGMGLSISRSIVESHGGRLSAESSSEGALFQFTLSAKNNDIS